MKLFYFAFIGLFMASCGGSKSDSTATLPDNHTAKTSLDWNGTYAGVLPCADCEGIATTLTLNQDETYTLKTQYLGKSTKSNNYKGAFAWNSKGNIIILAGIEKQPHQFFVAENRLFQLDMEGNRITGELAEQYVLHKGRPIQDALLDVDWELTSLGGKAIAEAAKDRKPNTIRFSGERVTLYAGCNNFSGKFALDEFKLRISPMISTKMACPDMQTEDELARAIIQVSMAFIYGDQLLLLDDKGRTKAMFKKLRRTPVQR